MFDKSTKIIIAGTLIGISVVGIYYYWKNRSSKCPSGVGQDIHEYVMSQINYQKLKKSVKEINSIMTPQPLDKQTEVIKKIFGNSSELVKEQFQKLTLFYRRKRRRLMDNPKNYLECIIQSLKKTNELKTNGLNAILAQLDLSEQKWSEIVLNWSSYNEDEWEQCIANNQLSIQNKQKDLSHINLKQIFNYQIHLLDQNNMKKYNLQSIERDQIMTVINMIVDDQIYKKFGVENQNIKQKLNLLSEEQFQSFREQMEQIQQLTYGYVDQQQGITKTQVTGLVNDMNQ